MIASESNSELLTQILRRLEWLEGVVCRRGVQTNIGRVAASQVADTADLMESAERILLKRRMRRRFFTADVFGEPAFDMLLDLFVHGCIEKPVSVTDACIGSGTPQTTGLRYIAALEAEELLERYPDLNDARRSYVRLTDTGQQQMVAYLSACANA